MQPPFWEKAGFSLSDVPDPRDRGVGRNLLRGGVVFNVTPNVWYRIQGRIQNFGRGGGVPSNC